MFNRLVNPVVCSLRLSQRNVSVPTIRTYKGAPPPASMDDLPLPSGSWETQYKHNQSRYNMHLAVGIVFAAVSLVVAKASGLLYLNYSPPKSPAKE